MPGKAKRLEIKRIEELHLIVYIVNILYKLYKLLYIL